MVIGATSGIGHTLSKILIDKGYKVGLTGRRKEKLEEIKKTAPAQIFTSNFDAALENNTQKLSALEKKMGGLDLLILCAGTGSLNENLDFELEHQTNLLNVNAFTEIINWGFQYFYKKQKGHLVCVSSVAGLRGGRMAPAYHASKAYQINYLEGLRQKINTLKLPIHVTDIRPGFVDTKMAKGEKLFWVASKEKASAQIWSAIQQKKEIVYVTKRWRLIAMLLKAIPSFFYKRM